ncbi:MAG TPA: hypothetical protein VJ914_30815 [Pseudonocardiaceae bacterium]|nr:hypothetical protein [Pseudonocardiaceae bacterium]
MQGKTATAGLVVLSSVLFVAAGVFCTLFLLNQTDPHANSCLAAAHLFAGVTAHVTTVGVPSGSALAVASVFVRECTTKASS